MKIYTKTGDKGTTSLYSGDRVGKSDIRVWAYGTIDEANSALGLARSNIEDESLNEIILRIQKVLFDVAAELASVGTEKYKEWICSNEIEFLEKTIDRLERKKPKFFFFMVPGGTKESAYLDLARTTVRKAERYIIDVKNEYLVSETLVKYINRLSDCIYAIARYIDFIDIYSKVQENIKKINIDNIKEINLIDEDNKEKIKTKEFLNREDAEIILKGCIEKAIEIGIPMVICVTDNSGNIIILERMDDALLGSLDIATGKAYTAAILKMPTNTLKDLAEPNGELYGIGNLPKVITFGGGFPIKSGDKVIGAVGVSGGTVEEDMSVAIAGIEYYLKR